MFRFLETATPRSFDLLVIDPPKFARARKDLEAARKGYERLNALALGAAPRARCWSPARARRTSTPRVRAHRRRRRQAGRAARARLRAPRPRRRPPLPPGFTEGQYLKVLLLYVD